MIVFMHFLTSSYMAEWNSPVIRDVDKDIEQTIDEFSYVMDLSLPQDMAVYETVPARFMYILNHFKLKNNLPLPQYLLSSTVRGMYKLYSHITKDQLAAGKVKVVNQRQIHTTMPWSSTLFDMVLNLDNIEAIINRRCPNTTTPVHLLALFRMHDPLVTLLSSLEHTHNRSVQYNTSKDGMTRTLLNVIDCRDDGMFGFTPLHIALANRDAGIAKALVSRGADVCLLDKYGHSALDLARDIFMSFGDNSLLSMMLDSRSYCGSSRLEEVRKSQVDASDAPSGSTSSGPSELTPSGVISSDIASSHRKVRSFSSCQIDTVEAADMNISVFVKEYLSKRRPLRIRGGSDQWPIRQSWQRSAHSWHAEWEHLELLAGSIPYADVFGRRSERVTVKEFMSYLDALAGGQRPAMPSYPYYVFDPDILRQLDGNNTHSSHFYDADANPHPPWLMRALLEEGRGSVSSVLSPPYRAQGPPEPPGIVKQFYWGPAMSVRH